MKRNNVASRRERWIGLGIAALALIAMGIAGRMDYEDAEKEAAYYCLMVALHNRDAELGWPDYNGTYMDQCDEVGALLPPDKRK